LRSPGRETRRRIKRGRKRGGNRPDRKIDKGPKKNTFSGGRRVYYSLTSLKSKGGKEGPWAYSMMILSDGEAGVRGEAKGRR